MTPIDWALTPLKKYADFSGRAPRAEYWWFILMLSVASVVASIIDEIFRDAVPNRILAEFGIVSLVLTIATFLPSLAAQVRRLHDTNRSGWWLLSFAVPYAAGLWMMRSLIFGLATLDPEHPDPAAFDRLAPQMSFASIGFGLIFMMIGLIMAIVILVFLVTEGTKGDNQYGPDPYGA